jgi:thiamine-phosphate pyrophosphorylase
LKISRSDLSLYAVTPGYGSSDADTLDRAGREIEESIRGGVRSVQLREKNVSDEVCLGLALRARVVTSRYSVPLIINDRLRVALACGADGLHIGRLDGDIATIRRAIGDRMILGVSVQTQREAAIAESLGADYLGVGAMFPTRTKADAKHVEIAELERICSSVKIPVVAIGGITADNAALFAGTGIAGIAVVSALFGDASAIRTSAERLAIAARKSCVPELP